MRGSFTAELLKLRSRPAAWALIGVWTSLIMAFGYLVPYLGYVTASPDPQPGEIPREQILADILPDQLVPNLVAGFPVFGGAIVLILGVLLTGSEYGWDTVKTMLIQGPGRLSIIRGKLGVLAVVAAGFVLVTLALGAAVSAIIAGAESAPVDWPALSDVVQGLAAGWLILMMWGLFGMLLGVLFQGPAMGVGLGLVWALVIENLTRGLAQVLGFFDTLQKALPGVNAGSLVAALGATPQDQSQGTPGVQDVVSGNQATVVLACYAVAFAVLAAVVLRRRDVT